MDGHHDASEEDTRKRKVLDDSRVPCPINPNHTVYARRLAQHVKVCPDLRFTTSKLSFYEEDCNAFRGLDKLSSEAATANKAAALLSEQQTADLLSRISLCYNSYILPSLTIPTTSEDEEGDPSCAEKRDATLHSAALRIGQESNQKHTPQQMSLLAQFNRMLQQRPSPHHRLDGVIELGAGKGGLAVSLQRLLTTYGELRHAAPPADECEEKKAEREATLQQLTAVFPFLLSQFIGGEEASASSRYPVIAVVDVDTFRRKGDSKVCRSVLPLHRFRVNLKDLNLNKALLSIQGGGTSDDGVDEAPHDGEDRDRHLRAATTMEKQSHWAAFGKHLCGACTDFGLACVTEGLQRHGEATSTSSSSCCYTMEAIIIATCCHHRCSFEHMVSVKGDARTTAAGVVPQPLLQLTGYPLSLTVEEFAAVTRMSSWGVCSPGDAEKQRVGEQCKRLLDAFRVEYLRSMGFAAFLTPYISRSITEENSCIVAYRCGGGEGRDGESVCL